MTCAGRGLAASVRQRNREQGIQHFVTTRWRVNYVQATQLPENHVTHTLFRTNIIYSETYPHRLANFKQLNASNTFDILLVLLRPSLLLIMYNPITITLLQCHDQYRESSLISSHEASCTLQQNFYSPFQCGSHFTHNSATTNKTSIVRFSVVHTLLTTLILTTKLL